MSRPLSSRVILLTVAFIWGAALFCGTVWAQRPVQQVEISGSVVDRRGHPAAGAEVVAAEQLYDYAAGRTRWGPASRATAGPDGRFRMDVRAERQDYINVVAGKEGLALGWQSPRFAGSSHDMTVCLGEPAILAGAVVDEAGKGIPEATVRLYLKMGWMGGRPGLPFEIPKDWFATQTDEQGRFRFERIPVDGTADFWVEASGKASCWTFWAGGRSGVAGSQFHAGQTDIRIVLKGEGVIRGKVVDGDSGRGVAGVRLLARLDERYANYASVPPVTSGLDGRFVYAGLAANDYSLQVVAPYAQAADWVGKDVKVSVRAEETVEVEVPVGKGGILEVTVRDANTQEPVPNAGVNVSLPANFGLHPCWYQFAFTDANGSARLRVPAGECRLNLWGDAYDYLTHPDPPVIVKGEVVRREAVLTPFPTVMGTVRDPSGRPASGVIVASKPAGEQDTRTDAQGRYEVKWRPYEGIRDVLILARDPQRHLAGLAEVKDQARPVDVTLSPAFVIRGRVTDPDGRPIAAARVSLAASMPGWLTSAAPDESTDTDGFYEFRAVPEPAASFQYRLRVNAEGFGPVEHRDLPFDAAADGRVEAQPVVLMPADRSISGVIVDANGALVPGVPIFITGPRGSDTAGQPRHQTSSDEQGRFAVEGVCAGPLRIQAGFGEEAGFLEAEGGDQDIEVVLGRRGVHTRLRPLLGKPLPDWKDLIDLDPQQTQGKPLLVCFFDFQQRPSRNTVLQLAQRADTLKQKGVIVIGVQASDVDADALSEWIERSDVAFPVGRVRNGVDGARLTWGVKSLPWLILTDEEHVVTAEGFAAADLQEQLNETGEGR